MSQSLSSNNIRAGAFLLVAIALGVAIIITLGGVQERLRPSTGYVVRFSLTDGAPGLEPNSEVRLAGRPIGRVSGIEFDRDPTTGAPRGVNVQIRIHGGYRIYDDAIAYLERPLLGAGAVLNLKGFGGGPDASPLQAGGVITGRPATPDFLAQAGYGEEQAQQLQNIFHRMDDITARVQGVTMDVQDRFVPRAGEIIDDVRAVTSDARQRSTTWFDRADAITENFEEFSVKARDGMDEARDFVALLRDVVEENRERIARTIENAESVSAKADDFMDDLQGEISDLVKGFLQDGRDALADARGAIERVDTLLAEQTPTMRKSLANFRLSSDQLRLTMGEIRRAPWRLLYRPDRRELEFELLYNAARSYADAVSDLRAATESIEAISASDMSRLAREGRTPEDLVDAMTRAFDAYRDAERTFLELLMREAP